MPGNEPVDHDLDTIVAVGDRERGVMPPCGRCRQFLTGCVPYRISALLPESYIWADQQ